jgi:hypothetical protein
MVLQWSGWKEKPKVMVSVFFHGFALFLLPEKGPWSFFWVLIHPEKNFVFLPSESTQTPPKKS